MLNIAVLVSGGGTNLQALIDAQAAGAIKNGRICCVLSSTGEAYALKRAEQACVETVVLERARYGDVDEYSQALDAVLDLKNPGLIVLAGFTHILSREFCQKYEHRMINVHPSLIPAFCGEGYYGLHVHQAALDYGVKLSGATVHFVSADIDAGPVILQRAVEVREGDTAEMLQARILSEAEHVILPRAVSLFCQGRIRVEGRRVSIDGEEI